LIGVSCGVDSVGYQPGLGPKHPRRKIEESWGPLSGTPAKLWKCRLLAAFALGLYGRFCGPARASESVESG